MNGSEGLSRIAKVIRYISYLVLAIGVFAAIKEGFFVIMIAGIPAAFLFAIAWIIDGFAKQK